MEQVQFMIDRANKLKALVSQMERHGHLNQSDMPLVCGVLMLEIHSLMVSARGLQELINQKLESK